MQTNTSTQTDQVIQQVINVWAAQNKAANTFFAKYEDGAYSKQIAAGRNRAVYLFAHLVAVSDAMLPLLGLGEKLYPEMEGPFIKEADNLATAMPSVSE